MRATAGWGTVASLEAAGAAWRRGERYPCGNLHARSRPGALSACARLPHARCSSAAGDKQAGYGMTA